MKLSNRIFGIVSVMSVLGFIQGCTEVEQVPQVTVSNEETKPRVYIDEVYKLQQLTQQLVDDKYLPPI